MRETGQTIANKIIYVNYSISITNITKTKGNLSKIKILYN